MSKKTHNSNDHRAQDRDLFDRACKQVCENWTAEDYDHILSWLSPADSGLPYRKLQWHTPAPATQVTDAHGRVWDVPYPGCYKSGSVRLLVDRDLRQRVDITIDGYWVKETATVDQAQAWVAAPKSQTIMERLWAWVSL